MFEKTFEMTVLRKQNRNEILSFRVVKIQDNLGSFLLQKQVEIKSGS